MARSRTIKRPRKSSKPSAAFLPESLQVFIARRLVDMIALALLAAAAFLATALISYNRDDPSLNTAADAGQNISNAAGSAGAWIADILLQTLGAAAFIPALCVGIWAMRIFRRQKIRPISLRLVALLTSALLASVALAQIPAGDWSAHPYLGSSAGSLILNSIDHTAKSFNVPYIDIVASILCGFISITAFLYAAAVPATELGNFWFRVKLAVFTLISGIFSFAQNFTNWVMHYNDESYKPEPKTNFSLIEHLKIRQAEKLAEKEEARARREEEKPREKRAPVVGAQEQKDNDEPEESIIPSTLTASIPVINPATAKPQAPAKKPKDTAQTHFALSENNGEWEFPPISMIEEVPSEVLDHKPNEDALRRNAELLQSVLADFNIKGEIVSIHPGPVVTLYELEPAPGTKSSRVISLSDDIARSMSAISVRCAVVPGRNVIGIELPNKVRQTVYMREMLESRLFEKTSAKLPLILGKDIGGQPILADLAKMPHLLVAGTTGSGKSVAVNTMIMSLLYRLSPEQCRFIMIDPKMLELSVYDDIPHLLSPVVTEPGKAVVALKWAVHEMENRYRNMSKLGVRNIEGYNQRIREALKKNEQIMHKVQTGFDPDTGKPVFEDHPLELAELPYIVIIVDEFADLMLVAGKDVENAIQRLAQMARAAGLHLIMATQRPSVDVITGVIKANFPTRISFQVTSKIDSRTILGDSGAEQLLGMGDMLYMAPGGRITRVHGPFVSDGDVEKTTTFLRAQATPAYIDGVTDDNDDFGDSEVMAAMFGGSSGGENGGSGDELYDRAVAVVAREGKASTSFIQRHLQIGYNRAARIIEEMEKQGVISKANAVGKREVLIRDFSDV
ncbi:MAG: DNA translocase FtsK 4TM domain-containing protein [Alphaproteobacteria bacterium]|nr:DNA translocase FtsK 4TM domain-containing protein [Alphaproteobacteria bacterium]